MNYITTNNTIINWRILDNDSNCDHFTNNTIRWAFQIVLGPHECNLQEIISICKQTHLVCMRQRWLTLWTFA